MSEAEKNRLIELLMQEIHYYHCIEQGTNLSEHEIIEQQHLIKKYHRFSGVEDLYMEIFHPDKKVDEIIKKESK